MKYKIGHINNNTGTKGWICGHFFPKESLLHTSELEVKFDTLKPGDTNEEHRHSEGTEVIIIIKGKIEFKLNGKKHILTEGDFIFMKNNVKEALIKVYEPTSTVVIRTPSVKDNIVFTTEK